jgi:methyl-accepting chemotaxis protein
MHIVASMKNIKHLKVTSKLLLLLVVMLIGFTAVGATYVAVLNAEKAARKRADKMTQFHFGIEAAGHEIGDAVVYQQNFLLNRRAPLPGLKTRLEDVEQFEITMARVRQLLNKLEAEAPNDRLRQLVQPVSQVHTTFYTTTYDMVDAWLSLGLDQNSGLQGDMGESVRQLENTLDAILGERSFNQLPLQKLKTSMLTMRRYEKDYILREDAKYIPLMAEEEQNFRTLLGGSRLPDAQQASLTALLDVYQKHFQEIAKATVKAQQARMATNTAFAAIAPALKALAAATEQAASANRVALEAQLNRLSTVFITMLLVTTVVVALIVFFLSRGITRPLQRLQDTVQQVAAGDMDARARIETSDEIGTFAQTFDNLLDERMALLDEREREREARLAEAERQNEALNTSVLNLLYAVSQLSKKDLTVKVPVVQDVTGPVADALNLLADETSKVLVDVTRISDDVARASRSVKTQSDALVVLADAEREQVTQTAEQLASAAEAMNDIADLAQVCNTVAEKAINRTQAALETVTGTVVGINVTRDTIRETEKRIKRLGERSQEISGAVNLINSIAERTHILALNASMHAASAGEAGRGFAVVADEVQRLAENARQATEQIASLVRNIQTETADTVTTMNTVITQVVEGSRLAEQAGTQMRETQQTTAELVDSVRRIAEGSQSQAELNNALRNRAGQIMESTLKTNQQLEEQGIQTSKLLDYASRLVQAVRVFRLPGQQDTFTVKLEDAVSAAPDGASQDRLELVRT